MKDKLYFFVLIVQAVLFRLAVQSGLMRYLAYSKNQLAESFYRYMLRTGLILATAPTVIQSLSGTLLAISASLPATYDADGYAATGMTYTAIGEVESFGPHGVTANIIKFTPVGTAVTAKVKGSKDYGTATYGIGMVSSDAGQVIVKAASESNNRYSVKLTYPLGTGTTSEIHYLDVLVSKYEFQDGTVDTVAKVSFMLEICRAPVIVAAT